MKNKNELRSPHKQQGALLVLTLIILLVVSMLGMSTMDTTGLEMQMSSNARDQQLAFEAAEYTLSWVENNISTIGGYSDESLSDNSCGSVCFENTCSDGYCFDGNDELDWANCELEAPATEPYESAALWADNSGKHITLAVPNTNITTKYIIEFRCYTPIDPSLPMDAGNQTHMYRVTALAVGEGGKSRVMLRSTMKL